MAPTWLLAELEMPALASLFGVGLTPRGARVPRCTPRSPNVVVLVRAFIVANRLGKLEIGSIRLIGSRSSSSPQPASKFASHDPNATTRKTVYAPPNLNQHPQYPASPTSHPSPPPSPPQSQPLRAHTTVLLPYNPAPPPSPPAPATPARSQPSASEATHGACALQTRINRSFGLNGTSQFAHCVKIMSVCYRTVRTAHVLGMTGN